MGFESPGSFAWAAAAIVVAVLYLWNFNRRRQEVATLPLWQRALARRPPWFVLRFWLSLLGQIVILMLLVTALSQPYWKQIVTNRRSMVLVLDVSASMSATDVEPSRFEQMRVDARRLIENLQRGEQLAILAADTTIRPVCRLGESRETLLAACDALRPTDGMTRVGDAVAMARWALRGQPNPQIVVLTDGGFPELAALRQQEGVRLVLIGQTPANAAVTHFVASPQESDPGRFDVSVEVTNGGAQMLAVPLRIGVRDGETEKVDLEIAPQQAVHHRSTVDCLDTALLQAVLGIEDDLAADNHATLRLEGVGRTPVRLVAKPSAVVEALQTALESVPGIEFETIQPMPSQFAPDTLYIFHGAVPPRLPPGRVVVLDPRNNCDLWEIGGTLVGPACTVATTALNAGLLSGVDLADVVFERASQLQFHVPSEALALTAAGDAIYSEVQRPDGPVLVLHADLDRQHSDFVLRPAFSQFVHNAMRWGVAGPPSAPAGFTTGDVVRIAPGATLRRQAASGTMPGQISTGPLAVLDHVGIWELTQSKGSAEDSSGALLPSNLLRAGESALAASEPISTDDIPLAEPASDQPLWMLLVGAALVLLVLECCLYHRRIVV